MITGTLYLIPTNLSDPFAPVEILPPHVIKIALGLNHYVAENAKSARAFLKSIGISRPLQEVSITELNEHTPARELETLLAPLRAGHDMGLVSEAGAPGVADPGAELVALAHRNNIVVMPLVGPSSILLGLMASGLDGQRFAFHGYLPQEKTQRMQTIQELERESRQRRMTQIFIETPYRNQPLLSDLIATLSRETRLCVACDLTGAGQTIQMQKISEWQRQAPALKKVPALFLFLA
jgi:16S rRNA (cytidine1402-2'-O)-methyltransferase